MLAFLFNGHNFGLSHVCYFLNAEMPELGIFAGAFRNKQLKFCGHFSVYKQLLKCDMLMQQHYVPMPWTLGVLERPLGNARLQTVRLIATLLGTSSAAVSDELMRLGTVNVLLVIREILSLLLGCTAAPAGCSLLLQMV